VIGNDEQNEEGFEAIRLFAEKKSKIDGEIFRKKCLIFA